MSMFSIGLSGLKTTQRALEVTSNNIANSSTAGFKSGSADFAAVYNGGQRGGVTVSNISENFDRSGSLVNTGAALDLAITGKGFFVISENGGLAYTQAGQFNTDADRFIVNANGAKLQGYSVDNNGNLVNGVLSDLRVSDYNIPARQSERAGFAANLNSASAIVPLAGFDPAVGSSYNYSQSTQVYDSLGNSHVLTQYFNHTAANTWEVQYYMNGQPLTAPASQTLDFDANGQLIAPAAPVTLNYTPATGAAPLAFELDMSGTTQFGSDFSVYNNRADGYTSGDFSGISVAENGMVYATFSNGETLLQGQVILASFANPAGLQSGNNTTWHASTASGNPLYGNPDSGTYGRLLSGAYMGSNVDISEQLVDLMSFQQNFQANAKTISSADQMMQILFNAT